MLPLMFSKFSIKILIARAI